MKLLNYFDVEIAAETTRNPRLMEKLEKDRKAFVSDGSLPATIDPRAYLGQLEAERETLRKAWEQAKKDYEHAGNRDEAGRLQGALIKLEEGVSVAGIKAETKIDLSGRFTPVLTSRDVSAWTLGDPKKIAMKRDGIILDAENFLFTKKSDYRRTRVKVELAATPGTLAFVALRAHREPDGWYGTTSMIEDRDGRICAGMEGLDFSDKERGDKRENFAYNEFFTITYHIREDLVVSVEVNGKRTVFIRHGVNSQAEKGRAGILVISGSVKIRSIIVEE